MNYQDIISLGWEKEHDKEVNFATFIFREEVGYDYHIMAVFLDFVTVEDVAFNHVNIKCVPEDTLSNKWENSETVFDGNLTSKEELHLVMQFLGIVEYKGLQLCSE